MHFSSNDVLLFWLVFIALIIGLVLVFLGVPAYVGYRLANKRWSGAVSGAVIGICAWVLLWAW